MGDAKAPRLGRDRDGHTSPCVISLGDRVRGYRARGSPEDEEHLQALNSDPPRKDTSTPGTCEWDLIWKKGLRRCNQGS